MLLVEGATFRLDLDPADGDVTRVCLPHPEIFAALKAGSILLVNDGKIRLKVIERSPEHAVTEVVVGGEISNRKGVNVPDVVLPLAALSPKDRKDLEFACGLGVDWLALSFVQRAADVFEARELADGRAAILSKIEKPAAVNAFAEILEASDGIMVARGDLGVELPVTSLPPIQKRLTRACRAAGKPVIVATQMLESMITSPVPTRAEVSDVATAIYEGTDAVMLSAESAAGEYPIEAVRTMNDVAEAVEGDEIYRQVIEAQRAAARSGVSDAITSAAREIAETTQVKAICCFSHTGTTALLVARERPRVPIIALTPFIGTARRLALSWGLHCVVTETVDRFKMAVVSRRAGGARRRLRHRGRPHRRHRRRAVQHPRLDQHPARRHRQRAGDLRRRRRGLTPMSDPDRAHWSRVAAAWVAWARRPGHDEFWYYRAGLADLIGRGDGEALDVGCGEGRVSRLLGELGYRVTATDAVPEMVAAARDGRLGRRLRGGAGLRPSLRGGALPAGRRLQHADGRRGPGAARSPSCAG